MCTRGSSQATRFVLPSVYLGLVSPVSEFTVGNWSGLKYLQEAKGVLSWQRPLAYNFVLVLVKHIPKEKRRRSEMSSGGGEDRGVL